MAFAATLFYAHGRTRKITASQHAAGAASSEISSSLLDLKHVGIIMRLDKYLKVSRLIKRRTVANEACDAGRVTVNDKVAKASTDVKVGDVISIKFGEKSVTARILSITETIHKEDAKDMYELM